MDISPEMLKQGLSVANSAFKASVVAEEIERNQQILVEAGRQAAERNATLLAGAEANIAQKELAAQQLNTLKEQNKLLQDNYERLEQMYEAQVQANAEAKDELERSKKFNRWMMAIAIIAMFAAIAGPIVTLLAN